MNDLIPSVGEIVRTAIITIILWGGTYVFNKYILKIRVSNIPPWFKQALIIYAILTLLLFGYGLYKTYGPLEKRSNEIISNKRIVLDGTEFINCQFVNDTLIMQGSKVFKLTNCTIVSPIFVFDKNAAIGVSILSELLNQRKLRNLIVPFLDKLYDHNSKEDDPIIKIL